MRSFKVSKTFSFPQAAVWNSFVSIDKARRSRPTCQGYKKTELRFFVSKILFCGQKREAAPFFLTKNENRTINGFSNLGRKKVIHFSLVDKNHLSTTVTLSIHSSERRWHHFFSWICYKTVLSLKLWIILKVIHKKAKTAQFYLDHRNRWPCDP